MPQVTGIITDNDTTKTIDFTGTVTNRKQTFYFDDRQDGMTIKNEDNVTLTLIVNGRSYTLTAKQSLDISERFISFNIVSKSAGTNKFSLTSYAFHSGTPFMIEDTLTSTNPRNGLSANQGRILNEQYKNTKTFITPLEFGAVGDGIANDSAKLQQAIDYLTSKGGGKLTIPDGMKFKGDFTISSNDIHIDGGGTLLGTIFLSGVVTVTDRFNGTNGISIKNIKIDGSQIRNGISCKWVLGVTIENVTFTNCIKAINFEAVPQSQHSSRFTINANRIIDSNYGLYVDYADPTANGGKYVVGDITFTNNVHEARRLPSGGTFGNQYHIWARGLDGLVCSGNTFFFGHLGAEVTNIYLDIFNWVHIEGNQFFEAGKNGIRATNGSNLIIANNNFAWTNEHAIWLSVISNGCSIRGNNISWKDDGTILINRTGVYVENSPFFIGVISDNVFFFPNEYAISIKDSSFITINGNISRNKYAIGEAVRINSFSTCGDIVFNGNQFTGYPVRMKDIISAKGTTSTIHYNGNDEGTSGAILNGVVSPSYKSFTANQTTIDISDSTLIVFANSSTTTITNITNEDLTKALPRIVRIYSYNSNTVLSKTIPNLSLKGTVNVVIPAKESMELLVYGGAITELSRTFAIT